MLLALLALATLLGGCGSAGAGGGGRLRIVAAESFWGSIANQLAGSKATVQSIIANPAQDPHAYEPRISDARALAAARLAIVNGIGYDPWASQLLAADPAPHRITLDVGHLLGLREGDNPHRWYDAADVERVADAITADLSRLDRRDAGYFAARRRAFERVSLATYHAIIATVRRRYAGVPVGASESIFAIQAPALGLRLLTPSGLMRAISEGNEVTAADLLTTQRQIQTRQIRVWVYNAQNTTPQVRQLNGMASAAGIPTVTITETLTPASTSFEAWQVAQLRRLDAALHEATGR